MFRRYRSLLAAAAMITSAVAVAVTLPAFPVSAATTTLCAQYAGVITNSRYGAKVETRNDWWGERGCLKASTTGPRFTISTYYKRLRTVVSYPDVMRGCQFGSCTPKSSFPHKVSSSGSAAAKWWTWHNGAAGVHNTAFDIWFGRSANYQGHAKGAELMIWLNSRNLGHPYGSPVIWVDGRRWWLSYWRACLPNTTTCWNYVRFWAVHPTNGVAWLRLHPFMRVMERIGKLRSWWYLWNVEAGYECWSGCQGMETTWFWTQS